MEDAQLNFGVRVDRSDGTWEPRQAIDVGNQNIFDAAIVEVDQDRESEIRSLAWSDPMKLDTSNMRIRPPAEHVVIQNPSG